MAGLLSHKTIPVANRSGVPRHLLRPGRLWLDLWQGNPPSADLLLAAGVATLVVALPLLYVLMRGLEAGAERWALLLRARVPTLLLNSLSLMAVVTAGATVVGLAIALLVERTELPARGLWRVLGALPLIVPPYVGALTYIIVFGPTGLLRDLLGTVPVRLYSFGGTAFVLTMFTYPYVYLTVSAALRRMNCGIEEAALSCGASYARVLAQVLLPLLRPAIGAGAVLVALYVLADFGAVAMLRYDTFTRAIYFQMTGRFDRAGAAVLSTVLIAVTLLVLWIEARTRRGKDYCQTRGTYRPPRRRQLGRWELPTLAFLALVFLFSVAIPVAVLARWSVVGVSGGALDARFFRFLGNSLQVAGLASVACVALAVPLAYLLSRHPSAVSRAVERVVHAGYALPGVVVALGILFFANRYLPVIYATPGLVVVACAARYLPQSLRSTAASLELVSLRIDEAARGLGTPPGLVLWKVILPTIMPGVLAGGALVFVNSLKELPTTLLLRPAGYDTLAVRIWMEAHEGFYAQAAPAALVLVLVSAVSLRWMLKRY